MRWFNPGNKDGYAAPHRVQGKTPARQPHRRGLTAGADPKSGLNLTASFRVSRTLGKNTQVALQNGRFVLRLVSTTTPQVGPDDFGPPRGDAGAVHSDCAEAEYTRGSAPRKAPFRVAAPGPTAAVMET